MSREKVEKRRSRERVSLTVLIAIFSIISFYTSWTGLIKLSGVLEDNYVLKIFMGILVGGLQFALVFSINAFHIRDLFRREWIKAVVALCIYVITMTLSVAFSFSYWYEEFSAESYAKRSSKMQLENVKENLLKAKVSFIFMEDSLKKLSQYSDTASNRERIYGRTCNPRVGAGEGVYTWLRADDATYSKRYSEEIAKLKKALKNEIEEVSIYLETFDPKGNVLEFNRIVNDRIKSINVKYFNNPIVQNLKSMLIERSDQNRRTISVMSKKTGLSSVESCMDRDFSIGANRVIDRIRALKSIEPLSFLNSSRSCCSLNGE